MKRLLMILATALALTACGRGGDEAALLTVPPTTVTTTTTTAAPTTTTTPTVTRDTRLTLDGLGPVRIGATLAEVNSSSDLTLIADEYPDEFGGAGGSVCGSAAVQGGPIGISVLTLDGRIARVDVSDNSAVQTLSGLKIGDSEATVRALYPTAVKLPKPNEYAFTQYRFASSDKKSALIVQLDKGAVVNFRAGEARAVDFPEGCL